MKDETIEDQNELIDLVEDAGFKITSVETREVEYKRHENHEVTDVTIELTVTKKHEEGFENPYQVK